MVSTELLRRYPLFAGQSHYMLEEIAMLSSEVTKAEGEWLFHENEDALDPHPNFYPEKTSRF